MARRGDGIYLRGRTWWLDFRHHGKRHVARLGKDIKPHVARELAQVQRAAVLKGEAGIGGPKRKDLLFEKAVEEFTAWMKANKRPRTVRTYTQCLKALGHSFNGKRLGGIDPLSIERHKRGRDTAKVMANRELAVLKNLYNRCRAWGKYEGPNPAATVKPTKESKGRLRHLEDEEEDALLAAAPEPLRTIILVGIYAGLRLRSEALTLRWADVDLRRGLLTVQAAYAKSGVTRTVNLNSRLRAALLALKERSAGEYVFTKPNGAAYRSIRTTFATACRHAGLKGKGVTPHVLRHTFASRLAMAGVAPRTIQELGGWSSLAMVERYCHLSPSHKADAVEKIVRNAANSPTLFTTPTRDAGRGPRNPLELQHAPVAQVDRAAVS